MHVPRQRNVQHECFCIGPRSKALGARSMLVFGDPAKPATFLLEKTRACFQTTVSQKYKSPLCAYVHKHARDNLYFDGTMLAQLVFRLAPSPYCHVARALVHPTNTRVCFLLACCHCAHPSPLRHTRVAVCHWLRADPGQWNRNYRCGEA